MARATTRVVSTADIGTNDFEGFLDMTAEAPGARAIEVANKVDREFKNIVEYERFMNMPVGIMISETTDDRESPVVPVGCNNDQKWLPRGAKIVVRRYMLERLLRASTTEFSLVKVGDSDAEEGQRMKAKTKRPYAVTVLKDTHPLGTRWQERICSEPA
jgi:hypothetical protein